MVKTTITRNDWPTEPPKFPRLYRNHRGYAVLFTDPTHGTVVAWEEGQPHALGHTPGNWCSCYDREHWTRLTPGESVTLTVE